jgi:hypothetical protein
MTEKMVVDKFTGDQAVEQGNAFAKHACTLCARRKVTYTPYNLIASRAFEGSLHLRGMALNRRSDSLTGLYRLDATNVYQLAPLASNITRNVFTRNPHHHKGGKGVRTAIYTTASST